jgi:hypothetical protein
MAHLVNRRRLTAVVYCALLAVVVWQTVRLVNHRRSPAAPNYGTYYTVAVGGNVDRPGRYRVPAGTTQLEILRVAGVRLTSDLLAMELSQAVGKNDSLSVGTLPKPVSLDPANRTGRLEFFSGAITVAAADGKEKPAVQGLTIMEGDRIQTDAESQGEISVGGYSRIDIDVLSEAVLEKLAATDQGQSVTRVVLRSGTCVFKIVYSSKEEQFKVSTGIVDLMVGGSGAEFVVEMTAEQTRIHVIDGLLLAERSGGEAINVIAGQSVTAFSDNRPLQVGRLAMEISPSERFSKLSKARSDLLARDMPFNILLCGVPSIYYFVGTRFDTGTVEIVRLPGETSVGQFARGVESLDQAFLYGGPSYMGTIVEQMLSTRVSGYCVVTRDDVARIGTSLGGIRINVDSKAAAAMGIGSGGQNLTGEQIAKYMTPGISGSSDSQRRQMEVVAAFIQKLHGKGVVLTALLAEQILANVQTNLTPTDLVANFGRFSARGAWDFTTRTLPVTTAVAEGKAETQLPSELDHARRVSPYPRMMPPGRL